MPKPQINPNNPRTIKGDKFKKLVRSIVEFPKMMAIRQMVYDPQTGFILGGNMRFQAAQQAIKELGLASIPEEWFKSAAELTAEEMQRFIVTDNISYGDWDWKQLVNQWDTDILQEFGMDVPEAFKKKRRVQEDDYEQPPVVETRIQEGDIIQLGEHRLMCADARQPENWKILMAGQQADMVMTDPPYNVDYHGGTPEELTMQNDKQSDAAFLLFLQTAFKAMAEITKPGGAWYVWHADSEGLNFRTAMQQAGVDIRQCLIWVKNTLVMGRQDYQWRHEPCLYGWRGGASHYFIDDRTYTTVMETPMDLKTMKRDDMLKLLEFIFSDCLPQTVLRCDRPKRNDLHPTMKPIMLISPLISNSSSEWQIVADGFIGAGSTMVACHQLYRKCFGMDIDPKYCQVTVDRMRNLDPDITITINGEAWT